MFQAVTVQFLRFNFTTLQVFVRDGETVAEVLRSRRDADMIDGYFTEDGRYQAL